LDSPANVNPVNANISYILKDTRWPYVRSWLLAIQRELVKNTVFEIGYNGDGWLAAADPRGLQPGAAERAGRDTRHTTARPDQAFGAITWVDPAGAWSAAFRAAFIS
jgi:hypothetical protein